MSTYTYSSKWVQKFTPMTFAIIFFKKISTTRSLFSYGSIAKSRP